MSGHSTEFCDEFDQRVALYSKAKVDMVETVSKNLTRVHFSSGTSVILKASFDEVTDAFGYAIGEDS